MGIREDDKCWPWARQTSCEIGYLRDSFAPRRQRATVPLLGEGEAREPIERKHLEYEAGCR